MYSEEDIENLWQLRFFKELGYKKSEIDKIVHAPEYDRQKSLETQIKLLEKKKQDLENVISVAKGMSAMGISTFSRKSNSALLNDVPFDVAIAMFGSAFNILTMNEDFDDMLSDVLSEDEVDRWFENIEQIMSFAGLEVETGDVRVQDLVRNMYDITSTVLSPSMLMFESGYMCMIPESEFGKEIDEIFGNNSSKYLFEAIQTFSKNNQNNSYDKELFECIGNIGEFGLKKYTTNSIEVQNEAKKIHELIMQIRLYNEKGQINLLSSLSKLFGSKEYKGIIDNGKEKGISWFVSRVLEIYVENITGGNANGK